MNPCSPLFPTLAVLIALGFGASAFAQATIEPVNPRVRAVAPSPRKDTRSEVRPRPLLKPIADNGVSLTGPSVELPQQLPGALATATQLSRLPSNKPLTITVELKRRNQEEMDDLVERLYNPKDPLFHHFLTPVERMERFSPTQTDFDTVARYLQKNGLTIVDSSLSRTSLTVTAPVGLIEKAFQTQLNRYRRSDQTEFYSNASQPAVPSTIAPLLLHVYGLEDASKPTPAYVRKTTPASPAPGSPILTPKLLFSDEANIVAGALQNAYNVGRFKYSYVMPDKSKIPMDGRGQKVGLVSFSDYRQDKIQNFIDIQNDFERANFNWIFDFRMKLIKPKINEILLPGYTPKSDENSKGEYELDIAMVMMLADGVDEITAPKANRMISQLEYFRDNATDVRQISISYSIENLEPETVLQELAMQGQAVFASSGDSGAFEDIGDHKPGTTVETSFPSSSPFVTAVGGTVLSFTTFSGVPTGDYDSERAWPFGGGGISTLDYGIPQYQKKYLATHKNSFHSDPNAKFNGDGTVTSEMNFKRSVPDVSMPAQNFVMSSTRLVGGTSASAPLWAAFCALLNQGRVLNSLNTPIGFLNPALYELAGDPTRYAKAFHDVTTGNNSAGTSNPGFFSATTGYDLTTGLGSFNGKNLIEELRLESGYNVISGFTVAVNGGTPSKSVTTASGVLLNFTVTLKEALPFSDPQIVLYRSDGPKSIEVTRQSVRDAHSCIFTLPAETVVQKTVFFYSVGYTNGSGRVDMLPGFIQVTVNPVALESFTFDTTAIYAPGDSATGIVRLTGPAPKDITFGLSAQFRDDARLPFPLDVTVPKGETEGKFLLRTTDSFPSDFSYAINAYYFGDGIAPGKRTTDIMIVVPPTIDSFVLSPNPVLGGNEVTGTIHFTKPIISRGLPVSIVTDSGQAGSLSGPGDIRVPVGQQDATFTLKTAARNNTLDTNISALVGGLFGETRKLTIQPVAVPKIPTTTTVGVNPNPFISGDLALYTIQVSSNQGLAPSGKVNFSLDTGFNFDLTLDSTGKATFDSTVLQVPPAVYTVTVTYKGSDTHETSVSTPYTLTILPGSGVTLTDAPNPSVLTQFVILSAAITPVAKTGNPTVAPTGTVTFRRSALPNGPSTVLGTAPVGGGGNAVLTTGSLPIFDNYIYADYSGDVNYRRGYVSFPLNHYVNIAIASLTLSTTPSPSVEGQVVTVKASISITAGAAVPTGTVRLKRGFAGPILATKSLVVSDKGQVTFLTSSLPVGTNTLVVEAFLNGPITTINTINQVVNPAPPAPKLSAGVTLTREASEIAVTVTVTNSGKADAKNVKILAATLGTIKTTTSLPALVGTVAAGGTKTVTLRFPGSIGKKGDSSTLTLNIGADLGAFTFGTRVVLP